MCPDTVSINLVHFKLTDAHRQNGKDCGSLWKHFLPSKSVALQMFQPCLRNHFSLDVQGTLGTYLRKEGFKQWNRVAAVPQILVWYVRLPLAKYEVRLSHYLGNIRQLHLSRGNYIGLKVLMFLDYYPSWIILSRNSYILCLSSYFLKTVTFKRNNLPCSLWLMLMLLNNEEGRQKGGMW